MGGPTASLLPHLLYLLFCCPFSWRCKRSKDPLLPLRLFKDRNRTGSYLAMLLLGFGPMGTLNLLTLYMQHIVGYSPIQTGLAWFPFGTGIILGAGISYELVLRFAPRDVAVPGVLIGGAAPFWLSSIRQEFDYFGHFMPTAFLTAFGFVMAVIALVLIAVIGHEPRFLIMCMHSVFLSHCNKR